MPTSYGQTARRGLRSRNQQQLNTLAATIGFAIVVLGLVVIVVGWVFGVEFIRSPAPGSASMKVSTAGAFMALGAALMIIAERDRPSIERLVPVAIVLSALTFIFALYTIAQYIADPARSAQSDPLLTWPSPHPEIPGRPSLITAISCALIAVALVLIAIDRAVRFAQIATTVSGLLGYVSLIGYAMNAQIILGLEARWTQLALHTALAIIVLSVGATVLRVDVGFMAVINAPEAGGRQARLMLPGVLALGLLVAVLTRVLSNLDIPAPIPTQVVTSVFIVVLMAAIILVARQVNSQEIDRTRQRVVTNAFDSAFEGVLIVNTDGRIDEVNSAICQLSGYSRRSLLGQPVEMLVPLEFRERHRHDRANFIDAGVSRRMQSSVGINLLAADGRHIPVDVSLGIIDLGHGPESVIVTVHDTTALVRANRELEQFAYIASHDLRAPLRAVTGFSQLLELTFDKSQLSEDQLDYLDEIRRGTNSMEGLISALLDYSRINSTSANREVLPVAEIVTAVAQRLAGEVATAGGSIQITTTGQPKWSVNRSLLESAIANLITNSIKYRASDRTLAIDVSVLAEEASASVIILDNGQGIPPAQIARATEMFRRLTVDGEGLGIGLASANRIVESHDGTLGITSDGETFTRIVIRIPTVDADPIQPATGTTSDQAKGHL